MSNQNKKITELDELTSIANEDMFVVVDDPNGTAVTKKTSLSSIAASLDFSVADHYHDGDTLQNDGIISNSGNFLLQTTGSFNIKTSGFTSKYIELYTSADQPRIKIHGGANNVFFESNSDDGAAGAGFACYYTALDVIGITAYSGSAELISTNDLKLRLNTYYWNYLNLNMDGSAFWLHAAWSGSAPGTAIDLKLTASSGEIDFDDDNLTTTGTVTGVNVTSGIDPGHTHTGSSTNHIFHETPTPATDGATTVFTVANAYTAGMLSVYLDGLLQIKTTDYSETNSTTFTMVEAPDSDEVLRVCYIKA